MKIREMTVGSSVDTTLVMSACNTRNTAKGKAYLDATFTDGTDEINAKMWDYKGTGTLPTTNKVYRLIATVGEYQGTKQLTLDMFSLADSQDMSLFGKTFVAAPNALQGMLEERIARIKQPKLQEIVKAVWERYAAELIKATSAKGIHHVGLYGNLAHTIETCDFAEMIADYANVSNYYDVPVSVDLCMAGALIHDIGKAWTYDINGAVISYTQAGYMSDHIVLGIRKLYEVESAFEQEDGPVFELLAHIISSHHGKAEYGSPTSPGFAEAHIVNVADGISAMLDTLFAANKKAVDEGKSMTDKLYTLNNKEHFLQSFIASILK